MTSPPGTLVEIGKVARAHGLRGEVRIQLHWEGSDTLDRVSSLVLERRGKEKREYRVRSRRRANRAYLVLLEGVEDRDGAEALRGATVSVPRSALPPPGEGEFYLSDLVGAEVRGPDGRIGEIVEIRVHPTTDTAVIRLTDGKLAEQPLVEPWLVRVDVTLGVVELSSTDGLI